MRKSIASKMTHLAGKFDKTDLGIRFDSFFPLLNDICVPFQHKLDKLREIAKVMVLAHPRPERRIDEAKTRHQRRSRQAGSGH